MVEPHSQRKVSLVNPPSNDLEAPRNLNPILEFLALNNKPHAQANNKIHLIIPFQKQNISIIK